MRGFFNPPSSLMSAIDQRRYVDEETPLLYDGPSTKPLRTPLPKLQIAILLFLQCCEPMTSITIFPYINQVYSRWLTQPGLLLLTLTLKLITELGITGGDKAKVGYYAGLIVESSDKSSRTLWRGIMTGITLLRRRSIYCFAVGPNLWPYWA